MEEFFAPVIAFFRQHWTEVAWIVVLVVAGRFGLKAVGRRMIKAVDDGDDSRESGKEKRAKTLASLITTTGNVLIGMVAAVWLLRVFGVDAMALLTGATVVSIAVGLALQTMFKDFIAGAFIFAENQYAVGDKVKIGENEGVVHRLNMRSTVLLDAEGNLIFIPNGSIAGVINYSLGADMKGKEPPSKAPSDAEAAKVDGSQAQK